MNIEVTGARILWSSGALGGPVLTETIVNMWIVMAVIVGLCIFLTRDLQLHAHTRRQIVAEYIVRKISEMVRANMGERYIGHAPFIAAILFLSAGCSLTGLLGFYPPTSDLSALLGWSLLVFALITWTKIRTGGLRGYVGGFARPVALLTPFNIISEIAVPVSMAFRHFGNIASGTVITALLYGALAALSNVLLGLLPGVLGEALGGIPILQVGLPAILSIYFDLFAGFLQAFIFCMLTMMYIRAAAED